MWGGGGGGRKYKAKKRRRKKKTFFFRPTSSTIGSWAPSVACLKFIPPADPPLILALLPLYSTIFLYLQYCFIIIFWDKRVLFFWKMHNLHRFERWEKRDRHLTTVFLPIFANIFQFLTRKSLRSETAAGHREWVSPVCELMSNGVHSRSEENPIRFFRWLVSTEIHHFVHFCRDVIHTKKKKSILVSKKKNDYQNK